MLLCRNCWQWCDYLSCPLYFLVATKRWLWLIRFLYKWYFVSANSRHRQMYKLTRLRKTEKCIADASSSLFMFLRTMFVRRRWFRREAGRYRRNNIPIATADFALRTSVTIYVYNYRALPMRIEPVGVFVTLNILFQITASSFLHIFSSFFFSSRVSLVSSWKRGGRKETAMIYYYCRIYLRRLVRGISRFSIRGKNWSLFSLPLRLLF